MLIIIFLIKFVREILLVLLVIQYNNLIYIKKLIFYINII